MQVSVGPDDGDLRGADDKILQAGIEYLVRLGGGILKVLPGEFTLRNSIYLHAQVTLEGSGETTVLRKASGVTSPFARLSEWFETEVEVEDGRGFRVGDGVMLQWGEKGYPSRDNRQHTVVEVKSNVLTLDRRLGSGIGPENGAVVSTAFPLLTASDVQNVRVAHLVLDGSKETNDYIDGNFSGGVFINYCSDFAFENVIVRNYNGDGISFQVCHDIHFDGCRSENNANFGYHPGSGAQRPIFRNCVAQGNKRGIFFCRGVHFGLVEKCECSSNSDVGIYIGDRDTDNRVVDCTIENNQQAGIVCTDREEAFRGAHRCVLEGNLVRDNGAAGDGVGIDVRGGTHDLEIRGNRLVDSGAGKQRIGIRVSDEAENTKIEVNQFEGMETDCLSLTCAAG
jgi:parallel beta-helix repeat protein